MPHGRGVPGEQLVGEGRQRLRFRGLADVGPVHQRRRDEPAIGGGLVPDQGQGAGVGVDVVDGEERPLVLEQRHDQRATRV